MPSMLLSGQRARVMAGGWGDVSIPLYSACCLHAAAAVKAGGGAVPAASCRTLGVAAAEKTGRQSVGLSVTHSQQRVKWHVFKRSRRSK